MPKNFKATSAITKSVMMRIRTMVHLLAVLTVVLTFSMPFTTLAQQQSVHTEVSKAAAELDRKPTILEIKAAAEQDASNDVNELLWFSVGLGIAYVGGVGGGIAGGIIGDGIDLDHSDTYGFVLGTIAGIVASLRVVYKSPVHVPAWRLIGKPPEYVELYTDTYQRKMRALQTDLAASGTIVGCVLPIIGCLAIISQ